MDIKDDVVRLYVKRFVIPKALIFDKPAFVDFKISGKTNVFARQILVPETFFVDLEKRLVDEYGDAGKSAMYSIGKKFGYSFSQLGRFENIKDHPGDAVKDWVIIASKFVEGTYASEIKQTTDVANETVDYVLKNFVICRNLGYDFFLATGGAAGVIAWLFQNKNIEGYYYQSTFEGKDHEAKVKCAPFDTLKKISKKDVFKETDLENLKQDIASYNKFNEEVEISYKKSFANYLDAKVFSYENGIIMLRANGERFFLMEVSGLYLLELELKKRKMDAEIFEIAYNIGKNLFGTVGTNTQSVLELLVALGWGEIMLITGGKSHLQVAINHYPWTNWYKEIDFRVVGGLLSGIFSKLYKREVKFVKPSIDVNNGYLSLLFKEE